MCVKWTHAGSQYFVTFIDDHSKRLWATPLKTKDQVLSVFKELHARVERESGRKLKAVSVTDEQFEAKEMGTLMR